jgi:predicted PurR-regulated permease PerM
MRSLGGSIILGSLFYTPACIILGTYYALVIVYRFFEERTIPKRFVTLFSLVIVAVGILGFNTVRATNITGPTYTMDQVIHMSEFGPEGVLTDLLQLEAVCAL